MDDAGPVRIDVRAVPGSVGQVRGHVRNALEAWGLEDVVERALLLASELATNAVLHARGDYAVTVERAADRVRVAVHDSSPVAAARRRTGLRSMGGRGLGLVEALALRWGSSASVLGYAKQVWFELPTDGRPQPQLSEGALYGEDWTDIADSL